MTNSVDHPEQLPLPPREQGAAEAVSQTAEGPGGEGGDPAVAAVGGSSSAPGRGLREVFWNLPNTITMARIAAVPILLFIPYALSKTGSQIMAWCYIAVALSDLVDGWLARRGSQVTAIGKLLDPLADKLLVSTALIMLLAVGRLEVWAAPMVVVIIGRELAVTGLRGMASSQGLIVAARGPGKIKTLVQNVAIGALLFHYPTLGLPAHNVGVVLLVVATALTLWSGYALLADYVARQR
jgi:CDP-diacylglycerol--glycerol-3-phosphate 3-phosphatidyltransferase